MATLALSRVVKASHHCHLAADTLPSLLSPFVVFGEVSCDVICLHGPFTPLHHKQTGRIVPPPLPNLPIIINIGIKIHHYFQEFRGRGKHRRWRFVTAGEVNIGRANVNELVAERPDTSTAMVVGGGHPRKFLSFFLPCVKKKLRPLTGEAPSLH